MCGCHIKYHFVFQPCTVCGEDIFGTTSNVVEYNSSVYHYPCLVRILLRDNALLQDALSKEIKDQADGMEIDETKMVNAHADDIVEKKMLLREIKGKPRRNRRRISFVVKTQLVAKLEETVAAMQAGIDHTQKMLMASKMVAKGINLQYTSRQIRGWKKAFEDEGILHVSSFAGKRLTSYMPWQRATSKRYKSHIKAGAGGWNMEKILKTYGNLLVRGFKDLVESWGMRCTWDLITHHFEIELAKQGINWESKHADEEKEFKRRKALVRNYLKYHRSRDKTFTVSFKLASKSKHSAATVVRSVRKQQAAAASAIRNNAITSHRLTWTEDETWINVEGCLVNRGLAMDGKALKVRSVSGTNKIAGYMFLTTVDWVHGCRMFAYKQATEAQWKQSANRYKVTQLHERVFQISVPPKKKISRFTHVWIMRAINAMRSEKFLYVYDAAGPHSGAAVENVIRSFRGVAVSAPMGGWTGVAQLADDSRVHGSLKTFVRSKAVRYFYHQATSLSETGKEVQIKAIPYKVLILSAYLFLYMHICVCMRMYVCLRDHQCRCIVIERDDVCTVGAM